MSATPAVATPPPPSAAAAPLPAHSEIYTASYSAVPVFEMMCRDVACMRRAADSYLNATQILKVAGIEKGQRTKLLGEMTIEHEKVQGGAGKFQGTWVNFEEGKKLAHKFGVEQVLRPLFEFDISAVGVAESTPTKEQLRKRQNLQIKKGNAAPTPLKRGNSNTTSASLGSPAPITFGRPPSAPVYTRSSTEKATSVKHSGVASSAEPSAPRLNAHGSDLEHLSQGDHDRAPKRRRTSPVHENAPASDRPEESVEPAPLAPLAPAMARHYERSKELLTGIFLNGDTNHIPPILSEPTLEDLDIDVPIDELGHTALHWASALARMPIVQGLIGRGANPCRVNDAGETALIRAVLVTNNLDQATFPALLNVLQSSIGLSDKQGRNVLHHVALTAGIKGRSAASRYYLECIMEWIVRQGQITKFVKEVVSARDKNGDTPLNIAARIGNKGLVQQLLDVGADPNIANRAGLRAADFGIGSMLPDPLITPSLPPMVSAFVAQESKSIRDSMISMMDGLDGEFNREVHAKHAEWEAVNTRLRAATRQLADLRRRLENTHENAKQLVDSQQRCRNLARAVEDHEEPPLPSLNGTYQRDDKPNLLNGGVIAIDPDAPFIIPANAMGNPSAPYLPPKSIIRARIAAYKRNRDYLLAQSSMLQGRSSVLEQKYKQVIAYSTGMDLDSVDALLEHLLQAVESDGRGGPDQEGFMNRVAGFLKQVEGQNSP
ncbi:transcriptional regulator swi6 [Saitoella coloradoensis]